MRPRIVAASVALVLAACGSDPDVPPPVSGWIDVPGMICADGSATGIGISRGSADAVLVYLSGGGACWGSTSAECNNSFTSFGKAEFDLVSGFVGGTIFDRTLPGNPFATWTIVFVPYCTGDVHAGDSEQTHGTFGSWRHHGYKNLQAAVARMTADVAAPAKVVVAGSSAGGFGALLAYDLVRAEWPAGAGIVGALVDDSGPTFVGSAIPEAIRTAWWDAWNLPSTLAVHCPGCGQPPDLDLSGIWPALRARHGTDRLALVSTTQDQTMRGFFGNLSGQQFQGALAELAFVLDGLPDTATFQVGGSTGHALLVSSSLESYSAGGTPLLGWLSDMVGGGEFASKGP